MNNKEEHNKIIKIREKIRKIVDGNPSVMDVYQTIVDDYDLFFKQIIGEISIDSEPTTLQKKEIRTQINTRLGLFNNILKNKYKLNQSNNIFDILGELLLLTLNITDSFLLLEKEIKKEAFYFQDFFDYLTTKNDNGITSDSFFKHVIDSETEAINPNSSTSNLIDEKNNIIKKHIKEHNETLNELIEKSHADKEIINTISHNYFTYIKKEILAIEGGISNFNDNKFLRTVQFHQFISHVETFINTEAEKYDEKVISTDLFDAIIDSFFVFLFICKTRNDFINNIKEPDKKINSSRFAISSIFFIILAFYFIFYFFVIRGDL